MKREIILLGLILCVAGAAEAQKKQPKNVTPKVYTLKPNPITKGLKKDDAHTYRLNSTSTWNAMGERPTGKTTLNITDPTIRILNERASGAETGFRAHEVMGVSKRMFGVAHGHILFRANAATTSGSYTGSGSVGTGSSPGMLGSIGPGMGVNGVSPNAGTGMNTVPTTVVPSDAATGSPVGRKIGAKKKEQ